FRQLLPLLFSLPPFDDLGPIEMLFVDLKEQVTACIGETGRLTILAMVHHPLHAVVGQEAGTSRYGEGECTCSRACRIKNESAAAVDVPLVFPLPVRRLRQLLH